jgi:UDP-N-acetylglucosamine--N-acetylmuramyl-(pentapeptide) pyrophosphoryl-undecaprenol N-acetylglucosamine transferase
LVPSPNVAEDHQTKNAMALVEKDAAIIVRDNESKERLVEAAIELLKDESRQKSLSDNISKRAMKDSAERIAEEIYSLVNV